MLTVFSVYMDYRSLLANWNNITNKLVGELPVNSKCTSLSIIILCH